VQGEPAVCPPVRRCPNPPGTAAGRRSQGNWTWGSWACACPPRCDCRRACEYGHAHTHNHSMHGHQCPWPVPAVFFGTVPAVLCLAQCLPCFVWHSACRAVWSSACRVVWHSACCALLCLAGPAAWLVGIGGVWHGSGTQMSACPHQKLCADSAGGETSLWCAGAACSCRTGAGAECWDIIHRHACTHNTHAHTNTHTQTHTNACSHIDHMHKHIHACTNARTHAQMHTHARTFAQTHKYTHAQVHTHAHMHTHAHTQHTPCQLWPMPGVGLRRT